jgi:hypothetical protein
MDGESLFNEEVVPATALLSTTSELSKEIDLYPAKSTLCLCKSDKKYRKCCFEKETTPFQSLEKGVKIVSDKELFFLEDKRDHSLLLNCVEDLNKSRVNYPLQKLSYLSQKYPDNKAIRVFLAIGYRLNQDIISFQMLLQESKDDDLFPSMELLRWWHVFECGLKGDVFNKKLLKKLEKFTRGLDVFCFTEFSLWGLIRICNALNEGRLGEAEEHFLSLIRVTERVNSGNHWALEEAEIILESAYFLRRLKNLEMHLQC